LATDTADFREAAKWLEKAASQGDAWAQFNLSLAFFTGKGVKANEVEALRLLRASAASKYTPARTLLAKIETDPLVAKKLELEIPIH
jgi:TPR repeat protein